MNWKFETEKIRGYNDGGELIAEAVLVPKGSGTVDIASTYVHPTYRGQGLAGQMMTAVAAHLREQGLKATASCPYAVTWLKRNEKAYADILAKVENSSQEP